MPLGSETYSVVDTALALTKLLDEIMKAVRMPQDPLLRGRIGAQAIDIRDSAANTDPSGPTNTDSGPSRNHLIPIFYFDAGGNSLSCHGELSILQIHVEAEQHSHTNLIHVHIFKDLAVSTKNTKGTRILKSVLEDSNISIVCSDVWMDSDAIYSQFAVLLAGIINLQLMKVACQGGGGTSLPAQGKCLEDVGELNDEEYEWLK